MQTVTLRMQTRQRKYNFDMCDVMGHALSSGAHFPRSLATIMSATLDMWAI